MAKIIAPTKGYNGTSASVEFKEGVGYTNNPHLIDWFKQKGYTVECEDPVAPTVATDAGSEIPPVAEKATEPKKKITKKGDK